MANSLPRMLSDFRPLTGVVKADYTDFLVDEAPLYDFDGSGTHTLFRIEKTGLSTMQAAHDVARALNVSRRDVGFAGLKDARAVARQWFSVEHVDPDAVSQLAIPRIRVLEVTRHRNKLRLGHLRENRFIIRVRETDAGRLAQVQDALRTLTERGVPNYFGRQRFGNRGDTWIVGRTCVRGNLEEALDFVLGRAGPMDHGDILQARRAYDRGEYAQALQHWPRMFRDERRALAALDRADGKKKRGFLAIDPHTRQFYVSAYQSHLFNRVVAARLSAGGLHQLQLGDLAWLHATGAVFSVTDPAAEQPRADAFEISPTGPLFGYRMTHASGAPGEMEAALLAEEGLTDEAFRNPHLRVKGLRRTLRFPIRDAAVTLGADGRGSYLELRFSLPRGCYATAVLRELFDESPAAASGEADEEESDD